jgi:hypothetical protein
MGKYSLIVAAATLPLLIGVIGLSDAMHMWTASPAHCPRPLPRDEFCVVLRADSGWLGSAWGHLVIGAGCLALGAILILWAERLRRRRKTAYAA